MRMPLFLFICSLFMGASVSMAETGGKQAILETLSEYVGALESGRRANMLPFYSVKTLPMMQERPFNPAMMTNEARTIKGCGQAHVVIKGKRAMILFSTENPKCSPYFLVFQEEFWRFDFVTMMRVIRFDRSNKWWIDKSAKNPYSFAIR